uniref:C2H2-type domain-containing protein n=1 Tax=Panagrellus redivivus TaxID=6233 RepID=A0A7E4VY92_PANRE
MSKRSNLIAIVNRLYLNASGEQNEDTVVSDNEASPPRPSSSSSTSVITSNPTVKCIQNVDSMLPLPVDTASKGFNAVGGCRRCLRTFPDRLSLIHHFVDHFPNIFYSFEAHNQSTAMPMMLFPPAMMAPPVKSVANGETGQTKPTEQLQHKSKQKPASVKQPSLSPKSTKANGNGSEERQNNGNSRFTDFTKSSSDLGYDMCPHCCQTFADHAVFVDHLKSHETPVISLGPTSSHDNPLKCEYCDLRFSNEYLLTEHKKIHSRICGLCGKTLMTTFDLNLHMGTHSGYSYDCKDCGRCFPDRKTLAAHNKMHRSDLSAQDSDDDHFGSKPNLSLTMKENVRKKSPESKTPSDRDNEDKPESFFKSNPYFENIFKSSPRKRRQRPNRNSEANEAKKLKMLLT